MILSPRKRHPFTKKLARKKGSFGHNGYLLQRNGYQRPKAQEKTAKRRGERMANLTAAGLGAAKSLIEMPHCGIMAEDYLQCFKRGNSNLQLRYTWKSRIGTSIFQLLTRTGILWRLWRTSHLRTESWAENPHTCTDNLLHPFWNCVRYTEMRDNLTWLTKTWGG